MKALGFAWVVMIVLAGIGWIMNIVAVFGTMSDAITGTFIMRVVGIFAAPLGAVMGYL